MVHVSATESVRENGRPQLQRWPRAAVRGLVCKSGKLAQSCAVRVQIVAAQHGDISLHSGKVQTRARAITTEDCKCSGKSGQPARPQDRGAERPRSALGAPEDKAQRRVTNNIKRLRPFQQIPSICRTRKKPAVGEVEILQEKPSWERSLVCAAFVFQRTVHVLSLLERRNAERGVAMLSQTMTSSISLVSHRKHVEHSVTVCSEHQIKECER